MGESLVQVTSGGGPKLHTWQRTVGANSVEDEYVIAGLPTFPTYTFAFNGISTATGASHIFQVIAGATNPVYLLAIRLFQSANATTAGYVEWSVRRITTAGTGGTANTAQLHDQGDAAAGAAGMTLPTVKGTEGAVPLRFASYFTQTPGAAGSNPQPLIDWEAGAEGLIKPIRIPVGVTQGLVLRNDTAMAGATVSGFLTIAEVAYS